MMPEALETEQLSLEAAAIREYPLLSWKGSNELVAAKPPALNPKILTKALRL